MSDKKASLNIDGIDETIELPIYSGSIGPDVIDVGGLTSKGMFTYDPGFVSTAACESQITYIDGGKGVLLHRGYRHTHCLYPLCRLGRGYYCSALKLPSCLASLLPAS